MAGPFRIRPAVAEDLPEVVRIERGVFPAPWSEETFFAFLGPFCLVAVGPDGVWGFVFARLVIDQAEVLDLAVDLTRRRRGVARALLMTLCRLLADNGCTSVHLEARVSNAAAIRLYEALGFREVGRRARYYSNPTEDAIIFFTPIGGGSEAHK
jgi:[ribosomal protein S18]-alanine N-acetyltransferase